MSLATQCLRLERVDGNFGNIAAGSFIKGQLLSPYIPRNNEHRAKGIDHYISEITESPFPRIHKTSLLSELPIVGITLTQKVCQTCQDSFYDKHYRDDF